MVPSRKYPREWLDQVPAVIFGCLRPGELRILLHPGAGMADGGSPYDIPYTLVPSELRIPNTLLWVKLDDAFKVVQVWRRKPDAVQ